MTRIADIRAREILDSRGNATVEADVILDSGFMGRAAELPRIEAKLGKVRYAGRDAFPVKI